ncbi:MAG: glycosyltransferase family 2 protein [Candidatus Magasanikbacteria bacterium]|nr:glycosyltransferase family 2 protein [Candidatus Magasanikbacteria bacterium]
MNISFVIPAYNEATRISDCIAAIQKEIHASENMSDVVEIIVVNNASTDETARIAEAAGAIVAFEPRKGIVHARARGYATAKHELIANIDADTQIPAGWLKTVKHAFANDKNLVVLSGPIYFYDATENTNRAVRVFYSFGYVLYFINKFILRTGSIVQGGNFVIKKSALEKAGGFDTSIEFYGEDTDIARRLFPIGNVVFTNKLFAHSSARRLKGDGLVRTGVRYFINYIWVIFFKKPFSESYNDFR